jgi:hypothetical protein
VNQDYSLTGLPTKVLNCTTRKRIKIEKKFRYFDQFLSISCVRLARGAVMLRGGLRCFFFFFFSFPYFALFGMAFCFSFAFALWIDAAVFLHTT